MDPPPLPAGGILRQLELLLWKAITDEGGAALIPYVEDKPERQLRFVHHSRFVEVIAEGALPAGGILRQLELLLWKAVTDEGGAATIPYVEDKPERQLRFVHHSRFVEVIAEGD